MIEEPAKCSNLKFEEGLVDNILDDTGDEPGALALMAYTLDELYKSRRGNLFTLDAYNELGGVNGAIGARAEEIFSEYIHDPIVLYALFFGLVEVNEAGVATRKRLFRSHVLLSEEKTALDAFVVSRLVVSTNEPSTLEPIYEVAHEAIFREWPRLRDWIAETKVQHTIVGRMEREAKNWVRHGRPKRLLPNQETINEYKNA